MCHEALGRPMDAATSYCSALKHIHTLHRLHRQPTTAYLMARLLKLTTHAATGSNMLLILNSFQCSIDVNVLMLQLSS